MSTGTKDDVLPLAQPNYGHLTTTEDGFTHWSTPGEARILTFDPACPVCFMEAQQAADFAILQRDYVLRAKVKVLVQAAQKLADSYATRFSAEAWVNLQKALAQLGLEKV